MSYLRHKDILRGGKYEHTDIEYDILTELEKGSVLKTSHICDNDYNKIFNNIIYPDFQIYFTNIHDRVCILNVVVVVWMYVVWLFVKRIEKELI